MALFDANPPLPDPETGTNNTVIASLFCACAREAGYGDLSFPSHLPETFGQFA
ncbi:MAG: hypothetical protein ABFD05_09215 [Anaerolineaceae bacterium]